MKKIGIYGMWNKVNGKWYIGQSVDLGNRWRGHLHSLRHNRSKCRKLQNAVNKHGLSNFSFHILELTVEDRLDDAEQEWITSLQSHLPAFGYNLETGGTGNRHRATEATKERMRHAQKERKGFSPGPEERARRSLLLKGKPLSPEAREKRRAWFALHPPRRSPEFLAQQRSDTKRGVPTGITQTPATIAKRRQTLQLFYASPAGLTLKQQRSALMKQRIISDETKKKISDAKKVWWQKKKENQHDNASTKPFTKVRGLLPIRNQP